MVVNFTEYVNRKCVKLGPLFCWATVQRFSYSGTLHFPFFSCVLHVTLIILCVTQHLKSSSFACVEYLCFSAYACVTACGITGISVDVSSCSIPFFRRSCHAEIDFECFPSLRGWVLTVSVSLLCRTC